MNEQNKQNKDFYEYFYNRDSDSSTKSGFARYIFYLLKSMIKNIDKSNIKTILEVGCGQGNMTAIMAEYFNISKIIAIDPSFPGIRNATNMYSQYENIDFFELDIEKYRGISDNKFDIVAAFEVLEHVDNWEDLLNNMIEFSNKYILLSFPIGRMRDYEVYVGHLRNFKKGEIEAFMNSNGFKTIKTYYAGFPFYSPLARDYINLNYNQVLKSMDKKFTYFDYFFHTLAYISFRYFSFKNIGDQFMGLFEKINITQTE